MIFIQTAYPWIKALHIIAVIAWMAGLFYLPRLFVYHVEHAQDDADRAAMFQVMERKLQRAIMLPAMIVAWACGLAMVAIPGLIDWQSIWPWTKAAAVLAMTAFHMWCAGQRKLLAQDPAARNGRYYRMANEVPTVLLVIIVISVIVRPF